MAQFRFYAELNDFLPSKKRKRAFPYAFAGRPSVKDAIEALGVPHTEVDLILVNGSSVGFAHPLEHGDRVAVYPVFESLDISPLVRLRAAPLRRPAFVLDVHLGKLARLLRMLGFDALYRNDYQDAEIVDLSVREHRIILTRDSGLLKHKPVTHGYWVRSTRPIEQAGEVLRRFDLSAQVRPFTRCIRCNGNIAELAREEVLARLPPRTVRDYSAFYCCLSCGQVYWKGSHYDRMQETIARILESHPGKKPQEREMNDAPTPVRAGFIGFGEVASTFSRPMREHGAQVLAYDILLLQDQGVEILRRRAGAEEIQFRPLPEVVWGTDYVLSTASTQAAQEIAQACVPYLQPGQVYIDLNSTAPSVKVQIAEIIAPSGADFIEGAILGAVGIDGARTRILVAGAKGPQVAETLTGLGLNVTHYSAEIGKASTFKMLRSVFSKGLEALLLELLLAGKRAGIERDLWQEVTGLMSRQPFERLASNWVQTHPIAYERRYHETVQVAETMREIGVEPIVTAGTEAFFKRSLSLGWGEVFMEKPDSIERVIDFMAERLEE